ncbi:MAG: hypothetical protein WC603_01495 [Candidatus Paceibacterota bacterium]|jgi:hypothetical protein
MAEKPKEKKHSGGGMSFGLEVLLFVVAIFIIWILMGGAKKDKDKEESMFLIQKPGQISNSGSYGSSDN